MRSNSIRICLALMLAAGGSGCLGTPAPAALSGQSATGTQVPEAAAADCPPQEDPLSHPDYCSFPANVRAFIDTRDACDHWRGEPIPEPDTALGRDRRQQISDGIKQFCTGTDKRLSALKASYAGDAHVMQLLDKYEPDIEADD